MKPTWCVTALWTVALVLGSTVVQAQSGSLEPPGTAVDGSGDPVATTQTQPSWDQKLSGNERFKLVLDDQAVLDRETGLVWELSPMALRQRSWGSALAQCTQRTVGGRRGWRLPSVHELASLLDPGNPGGNPNLPAGHPFSSVQSDGYWSATTSGEDSRGAWNVDFSNGFLESFLKTATFFVWCVRSGGPLSEY